VKTTRYFEEQVLRKRPDLRREWIESVIRQPVDEGVQADGRIRLWGRIVDPDTGTIRFLRVVLLEDGETVHNAFLDRNFGKRAL
jgi:hypothetical protein